MSSFMAGDWGKPALAGLLSASDAMIDLYLIDFANGASVLDTVAPWANYRVPSRLKRTECNYSRLLRTAGTHDDEH